MASLSHIDTANIDLDERVLIPPGSYSATIVEADQLQTKSGNGTYVKICWQITGPSYQNLWVWQNVTIDSHSQQAEAIGRRQLLELSLNVGFSGLPDDTDEFVGRSGVILVYVKEDPQFGPQSQVRRVLPAGSIVRAERPVKAAAPARAQSVSPPRQPAPASDRPRKPWRE